MPPRITLDQWNCLVAVVEQGGYAQAGQHLHKSQSAVTYAVQKLESLLGIEAFRIVGRRATLTPAGEMLYRRARQLLEDAAGLELAAGKTNAGWESQIGIAVEVLFPVWLLLECFDRFGEESPHTRIELYETVLGGAPEALRDGLVELAITPNIPPGFNGEQLGSSRFIPVAHFEHPLHRLDREITLRDLRRHRHLVVRDSATQRSSKTNTVDVAQRWTVTNMATSIGAVCRGYGFAWLPEEKIRAELDQGLLLPLRLKGGNERNVPLYFVYRDAEAVGPGVRRLAEIVRDALGAGCKPVEAS